MKTIDVLFVILLMMAAVYAVQASDVVFEDGDIYTNGTLSGSNASFDLFMGNATDLECVDCLSASEIQDIFVLNTGDSIVGQLSIVDATNNVNFLYVDANGNASGSSSVGGAIRLDNTQNKGAGFVIYSNLGSAASGHLMSIRADNSAFDMSGIYVSYDGTVNAVNIVNKGSGSGNGALNLGSSNPSVSALQVSGNETGQGTVKISHQYPGSNDANAAGLSIDLRGSGTAAQGIFVDATQGGTTGNLVTIRNNNQEKFIVDSEGVLVLKANTTQVSCGMDSAGAIYFNGDTNRHYGCNSTDWAALY